MIPFLDLQTAYRELKEQIDEAIHRVLESGWYLLGKELEAFEQEFATYTESRFTVGLGNGLEALVLALKALEVGPGDEVIVPANTYIATWLAVSYVGATPVPVEPIANVWNIDPNRVEEAITVKTKAILPVHLYGQPADLLPLQEIVRRRNIYLIEDAAQAHGARYHNQQIGAHSDIVCWSFYPGKNLGCLGDGGAITTNNEKLAKKVKILRNYGSSVKYYNEVKGHNSRLDEIQAAVLRVKLEHLSSWNQRRAVIAKRYLEYLSGTSIQLPCVISDVDPVWHLFVIDHPKRDVLQEFLQKNGVQTLIHYPIPPHQSKAYAEISFPEDAFPITAKAAKTHLSLPIGPHLALHDVDRVIALCRQFTTLNGVP
jgi:dTDP-3-amino-3,4,6-trideoxy-alpha-D-glucose transaminase